ncbi:MAG: hypothetical protein Q9209_002495 [Squamulea sp. 1 TL-2023]
MVATMEGFVTKTGREPPHPSTILDLMMPMLSGGKDEFGREVVPPRPLTFDRISEGRLPASNTKLLYLPTEILALVVEAIPQGSLGSFALVNSDCRQLARSRQFASLHFDYSFQTWNILQKLGQESVERASASNNGKTKNLALGPCIRRLTVATSPSWLERIYGVELSDEFQALPEEEKSTRMRNASKQYFGVYIPTIERILKDQATLPHLELLDWQDHVPVHPSLFDAIVNSSIRHFKAFRVQVSQPAVVDPPRSHPRGLWPLQTLHLEIVAPFHEYTMDLTSLCICLLKHCSATLKSLMWANRSKGSPISTDQHGPFPSFPSLRHLRIRHFDFVDTHLLRELVHDELISLDVDMKSYQPFFDHRGRVPGLQVFVWDTPHIEFSDPMVFLEDNTQLSKLSAPFPMPKLVLEERILPLLAGSFSNLKSLSLLWAEEEKDISMQSLELISRLASLEQLHLSAGTQWGWRNDWLIDHEKLRHHLSRLPLLNKLAFSRDSYSNGIYNTCERYYVDGWFERDNIGDSNYTQENFEEDHRNRILHEADLYAEVLPRLEWLYFGQIPMAIKQDSKTEKKHFEPLTLERDDCWTLLRDMFGWKEL